MTRQVGRDRFARLSRRGEKVSPNTITLSVRASQKAALHTLTSMDEERQRLLENVEEYALTRQSSRPSSSSRRLALAVTASACVVVGACVATYVHYERQAPVTTRGVWSGSLSQVSWNPASGFSFKYESDRADYRARAEPAGRVIEDSIRKYYPSRIAPTSPPFDILYTIRDEPVTKCFEHKYNAEHCRSEALSPVFAFGSSPKNASRIPFLRSATLSVLAQCLDEDGVLRDSGAVITETTRFNKCKLLSMNGVGMFRKENMPDQSKYEWSALYDKAVWRGSDYPYLSPAVSSTAATASDPFVHSIELAGDKTAKIKEILADKAVGPRFRAVLMSFLHPNVIDAKFFNRYPIGGTLEQTRHEMGFSAVEMMTLTTMGRYKYQLDLGGAGGTTWRGVLPKLAMPGVLFHHETPMRDSFYSKIEPWKHYLPLDEDLGNFFQLIEWVKLHPDQARRISATATKWVEDFTTVASQLRHNYEALVVPLGEALAEVEGAPLAPVPFIEAHPGLKGV